MTTLREAALMALDALEEINKLSLFPGGIALPGEIDTAMDMLRTALKQQTIHDETRDSLEQYTQEIRKILSGHVKREWQNLEDEEIEECWDGPLSKYQLQLIREIEAKLREKNT